MGRVRQELLEFKLSRPDTIAPLLLLHPKVGGDIRDWCPATKVIPNTTIDADSLWSRVMAGAVMHRMKTREGINYGF